MMTTIETSPIQHEIILNPITGLSFYTDDNGRRFLLAGEGSFVKIYDVLSHQLVCQCKIFDNQILHGIISKDHKPCRDDFAAESLGVVFYGGRSYSLFSRAEIQLMLDEGLSGKENLQNRVQNEQLASDWLLDAAIDANLQRCLLVTAHSAVLVCNSSNSPTSTTVLISGSPAIFYSAHIVWTAENRFLLAAGSVFGEIEVTEWQDDSTEHLHTFVGHEGSVFGVSISEPLNMPDGSKRRLLASCSDDRTIRLWYVGFDGRELPHIQETNIDRNTGFGDRLETEYPALEKDLLAMVMGHASRIWKIRFVHPLDTLDRLQLLSFGEDATCMHWSLDSHVNLRGDSLKTSIRSYAITHRQTFGFHQGKHIFSSALTSPQTDNVYVATGGGDGSIAMYTIPTHDFHSSEVFEEWIIDDIVKPCPSSSLNSKYPTTISLLHDNSQLIIEDTSRTPVDTEIVADLDGKKKKTQKPKKPPVESITGHALIAPRQLIVITSFNKVLLGGQESWTEQDLTGLSTRFNAVLGIPEHGCAFLTSSDGMLYICRAQSKLEAITMFSHGSRTASLLHVPATESKELLLLISHPGVEIAQLLSFDIQALSSGSTTLTPYSRNIKLPNKFAITAARMISGYLILGSRNGCLVIFQENSSQETLQCVSSTKGGNADAVTSVVLVPSSSTAPDDSYFVASSRFGPYSIYRLCKTGATSDLLTLLHQTSLPLTSIESAYFHRHQLHFTGFTGKSFVVWNETRQREVFNVLCGGGTHRDYVYQHQGKVDAVEHTFAWTKARKLYMCSQQGASYTVIKPGGHGREIKACDRLPALRLIATIAEDTTIKLYRYRSDSQTPCDMSEKEDVQSKLECCATVRKHTAGPQVVRFDEFPFENANYFLYTSGGYEEFYIWRLVEIPGFNVGLRLEASLPDPLKSGDQDLRITAIDVRQPTAATLSADCVYERNIMLAYSDSTIKYLHYSTKKGFRVLAVGTYTAASITHIETVAINGDLILITTSTDGHVAFWTVPSTLSTDTVVRPMPQLSLYSRHKHHQNAILACQIPRQSVNKNSLHILTASDDNSITLAAYSRNSLVCVGQVTIPSAHSAAITGLSFLAHDTSIHSDMKSLSFWSVSIDQVLKRWTVELSGILGEDMHVRDMHGNIDEWQKRINTADIGGMISWAEPENRKDSRPTKLLVFGAGIEILATT